jgi:hypothetical protein
MKATNKEIIAEMKAADKRGRKIFKLIQNKNDKNKE